MSLNVADEMFECEIGLVNCSAYLFDRFKQLSRVDVLRQLGQELHDVYKIHFEQSVFVEIENAKSRTKQELFVIAQEHIPNSTNNIEWQ